MRVLYRDGGNLKEHFRSQVDQELEHQRSIEELRMLAKAVHQGGHARLTRSYQRYRNATQFRTKMERASEFLARVRWLDSNGVILRYAKFMEEYEGEL